MWSVGGLTHCCSWQRATSLSSEKMNKQVHHPPAEAALSHLQTVGGAVCVTLCQSPALLLPRICFSLPFFSGICIKSRDDVSEKFLQHLLVITDVLICTYSSWKPHLSQPGFHCFCTWLPESSTDDQEQQQRQPVPRGWCWVCVGHVQLRLSLWSTVAHRHVLWKPFSPVKIL